VCTREGATSQEYAIKDRDTNSGVTRTADTVDVGCVRQHTVTVSGGGALSPLLDFVPRDLGCRTARHAHEVVVVPRRTRSIQLFAAASHGVSDSRIHQCLKGSVHRRERRSVVSKVRVQTLGRDELWR
jgi:hypothetical protein